MSRKKKKLRFYNKKPDTEYYNKTMQKLSELIMNKEAVSEALLETSFFMHPKQPERVIYQTTIRCTECLIDITVVQAVDKDHGTIACPNCKANLQWSTGKNEKGDTVTYVWCGPLLVTDPSEYVIREDLNLRGI